MISPHLHPESPLTASTLSSFMKRAKELGRTHFAVTDNGHLASIMKAYKDAKKQNLKLIPGIEVFFKDPNCPILSGSEADRCKYFTLTLYVKDQASYQELCKKVSGTSFSKITINDEEQQLWSWRDLEDLSNKGVEIVLGGPHCMVGKVSLAGRSDLAEQVFLRLKNLYPDRLSVALTAEPWKKKWSNVVSVEYMDGTKDSMLSTDFVSTDKARRIKVVDLVDRSHHITILAKYSNSVYSEVNKNIKKATLHSGFLPLSEDVTLHNNNALLELANKHGHLIMVSDYAYYAEKSDKIVQTMVFEGKNRLQPNLHMKTEDEVRQYLKDVMNFDDDSIDTIISNNDEWAKKFDSFQLKYEVKLVDFDGDPTKKAIEIVKAKGRMKWDNLEWRARLKEEIDVIANNPVKNLLPYFFPIIEINEFCNKNSILTGVARGSAGGSLLLYLMGVTNLNPMTHGLSFQRFLSLDRINNGDWPDVDCDFSSRDQLFNEDGVSGFLNQRFGDGVAQVSTKAKIRLKSAILDVNRYFNGKVQKEIESLSKGLPNPPQGVTDEAFVLGYETDDGVEIPGLIDISPELAAYSKARPDEWSIVQKSLGLTRSFGVHPCATVLSSSPIKDLIPLRKGRVTQYEYKDVESCGALKYDILKVSQLKDIEICLQLINKKNGDDFEIGYFNHNGQKQYIWDLTEDLDVYKSVWDGNTATIFQLHTKSMTPFVKEILPQSIDDLSVILAIVRPGTMDFIFEETGRSAAEEYVARRKGLSQCDLPELEALIPETYGTIVYQEQSLKISKDLGGMSPADAERLRRHFSKKDKTSALKMKPTFMKTATEKIGEEKAEKIWSLMETSARYSFNKSHSSAYSVIAYACMFLRHHYPLEWWAAILTNAEEKEITGVLWPHVKDLLYPPDINLSTDQMVVDYTNNKIRSKLGITKGAGESTVDPIVAGRPYKNIQDFVNKEVATVSVTRKFIHVGVLDSLFKPGMSFIEKLNQFEQSLEIHKFKVKQDEAVGQGKILKQTGPKVHKLPEEYLNLSPVKDAAMKKAVLPSMPISLYDIGSKHSKVLTNSSSRARVLNKKGIPTLLVNGNELQKLSEIEGHLVGKDVYVAATCFVISAAEFSYSSNSKRALKMIVDADGYTSERVMWPDYNTGKLEYPIYLKDNKLIKKGCIATIFFKKRVGKSDLSMLEIVIET